MSGSLFFNMPSWLKQVVFFSFWIFVILCSIGIYYALWHLFKFLLKLAVGT